MPRCHLRPSASICGCLAVAVLGVLVVNAVAGPAPPVALKSDEAGRANAPDEAPETDRRAPEDVVVMFRNPPATEE